MALIGLTVRDVQKFLKGSSDRDYENPKLTVEVINMNGTTNVNTNLYYLRVCHVFACDWGSGDDDAAGNITVEYPENTALLTIAANYNESNASVLYFHAHQEVLWDYFDLQLADTSIAAADGIQISCTENGFEDELNDDADLAITYITDICDRRLPHVYPYSPWITPRIATNQAYLTFKEILIANSQTYQIHIGVRASKS